MELYELSITFEKEISPLREREIESVMAMSNGYIGTRNSLEEYYPGCDPASFIANLYVKAPGDEFNFLPKIPDWTRIKIFVENEPLNLAGREIIKNSRYIDFTTGTIERNWQSKDEQGRITTVKIIKYISLATKNELGKLLVITPENYTGNIRVITGIDCDSADFGHLLNMNRESDRFAFVQMKTKYSERELKMFHKSSLNGKHKYNIENSYSGSFEEFEWHSELGREYKIKSLCTVNRSPETNFDESMARHATRWKQRWDDSAILIKGNVYDQKLVNFATYHLINAGEFSGNDCSIPARSLSGEAYKGHVFWDTEMYLLPFYILTNPEVARALLMYRYNTLDGARQNAINEGFKGASYAWESTDTGLEEAPEAAILPDGQVIPILSGMHENHISSDIAYTVWKYWEITGDDDFLMDYGAEILFETARYCECLLKKGNDGLYHINSVIGPDEYHELVDDNAYTNYLVRNNFDVAVKAKQKMNIEDEETKRWNHYKNNIYSGLNPKTGLYEQFKGFYNLEYVNLKDYEPRTVPMDIILGREKTQKTQVIKQADVLMFMFLFGERFSREELAVNYDFYELRCSHGSSLSPSIHSITAARAGKTREAYEYFLKNARIDIGNEFGNASGGVHIAAMGGTWMAIVMGFAGLYYDENGFRFDPHLPDEWDSIEFSLKWKGKRKDIYIDRKGIIAS